MRRMLVVHLVPIVAIVASFAFVPVAKANDLFTLDANSVTPGRVVEDSAGNAYLGWVHREPINQPQFCKIPPGGICTHAITLPIPGLTSNADEVAGVFPILGPGEDVFVLAPRYVDNDVILWFSTNGGKTFGAGSVRAGAYSNKTAPSNALLTSGGTFMFSADNNGLGFSDFFALASTGENLTFAGIGAGSVYGSTLGLVGSNPVEAYWLSPSGGPSQVQFFRYDGSGSYAEQSNWVGPTTVSNGYESKIASGGSSGLFLVTEDYAGASIPTALNVRRYDGTTFGAPVTLANGPNSDPGLGGAIAESPGGRLAVAWPGTREADKASVMRLFMSTNAGASFTESDIAHLGKFYAINDNAQLAVDDGGQGWLTYLDEGGLHVADLNPIAPPSPSPPAVYKGPTKTVTKQVDGFLLTLRLPKSCLQPQQPFFIGVGKRARHKVKVTVRGKLKILKVTFKFDGRTLSTKKHKPFRQLISPPPLASGSTHSVAARVRALIVKRGHGKKVVRVLRGTIKIC